MTKTLSLRTMWLAHCFRCNTQGTKPLEERAFKHVVWHMLRSSRT
jgi:hypothetical protein